MNQAVGQAANATSQAQPQAEKEVRPTEAEKRKEQASNQATPA